MRKNRITFIMIFALFALVLGVPFLLRPRTESMEAAQKLYIYSPHPETTQWEFERGFNDYRRERNEPPVDIQWLDAGGSSAIVRTITGEFAKTGGEGIGKDIMFGGGDYPFYQLENPKEPLQGKSLIEPVDLPAEIIDPIPPTYSGFPLYSPKKTWYGTVISGFGIVYNRSVLEHLGVPPPKQWEDLADPRLQGWVASGDPMESGSVHTVFEIILQSYGFEKGFAILSRMGGNTRYFSKGASDVIKDVGLGDVACGTAIDFYAGTLIGEAGPERIGFVYPEGRTIFSPDCIGILKGPPNSATAKEFVEFVMSPRGQKLWMYKAGVPEGPKRYALWRKAVLPSIYNDPPESMNVDVNPFELKPDFKYNAKLVGQRYAILNVLLQSALVDNAQDLQRAWTRLIERGLPPQGLAEFDRCVVTETELLELLSSERWKDPEKAAKLRTEWTNWFRNKYRRLAETE